MMMKQYRPGLTVAASLLIAAAGCDPGFLEEVPADFVAPDIQTEADAVALTNGAYREIEYNSNIMMVTEFTTEMVTTNAGNVRGLPDTYEYDPSHSYIQSAWSEWYQGINVANMAVQNIPQVQMNLGLRDRLVGEARFLRAYNYFNLVRMFGDVPLRLVPATAADELAQARNPAAEVYDQVIKDLEEAEKVLPAAPYAGKDVGRARQGAAQTLLAKVYAHRAATGVGSNPAADFGRALEYARKVRDGGRYSLQADYARVFAADNENNSEVIFDIQASRQPGLGAGTTSSFAPASFDWISGPNYQFQVEYPFFLSYDPADKRKAATWLLSFVNRKGQTIAYDSARAARTLYRGDTPASRKFLDFQALPDGTDEINFILLRYADLLLTLAEAANEVSRGPTPEAYAAVNAVRTRAGLAPLSPGLGYAAFKDAVFLERRYELAMEPHGFFDSQRHWEWARARIEASMATRFQPGAFTPEENTAPIEDRYKLMPIPQRARDLNGNLTQNAGW